MIHLPEIITAISALLTLSIGLRVLARSPDAPARRFFAAASFCFCVLSGASLLILNGTGPERVLRGLTLLAISSFLSIAFVVSCFRVFGKTEVRGKDRAIVSALIGAGLVIATAMVFLPPEILVRRIHFMREADQLFWGFSVSSWGKASGALMLLSNVYVLHRLENIFRASNIPGKVALKYPLLGVIISSLINFTVFSRLIAVSILNRTHFAVLGSGTIFLGITWLYSIIRYQPLRITVRSYRQSSSFSITLTGLYLISLSIISYISSILEIPFDSFTVLLFVLFGAFILLAVAMSGKTRRRIRSFISENFLTDRYNYRKEWRKYSRIMSERDSLEDLLQDSIGSVCESMLVSRGCICTSLHGGELAHYGDHPGEDCVSALLRFGSQIPENNRVFFFNTTPASELIGKCCDEIPLPACDWIRALAVLHNTDRSLGVIALGSKDTSAKFIEEDRNFLSAVSEQLSLALENLLLSERIIESDRIESFNRFASFVIHDLKNTLGMLSLTAENARENISDPGFQKDAVEVLRRAVEKINHLISSLSAHRSPPSVSKKDLDVAEFLISKGPALETIAESGKTTLDISFEEGLRAFADPDALDRIIDNLVLNAVEASDPGERVTLRAESSGEDLLEITVTDQGEGFEEEYLNRDLFKPFRSTKKNGLGIGLVMCKTLAEAHNGTIIIENGTVHGASVTLRIPRRCD